MKNKKVYLTFDDGIQEGTINVLRTLAKNKIRATFFLTGINTYYAYKRDSVHAYSIIKDILNNHLLCNHSFSHCYDFYHTYYSKGLLVSETKRISALQDFYDNEDFLRNILVNHKFVNVMLDNSMSKIARLPGRNSWCLGKAQENESSGALVSTFYREVDHDSGQVAKNLFSVGYQVFGWDEEWKMSFDFVL